LDKVTRARAEYQDTPKGIHSCATCTLFDAPNGCKVVEGEVSKDSWRKAFACRLIEMVARQDGGRRVRARGRFGCAGAFA
jgi:hypothetical protein